MGYIERETAREAMLPLANGNPILWSNIKRAISAIPVADVVSRDCYDRLLAENDELRKERPVRHGQWVTKKDECGIDYTICSACETEIQWRDRHGVILIVDMQTAPYCPYCGARMDGDEE